MTAALHLTSLIRTAAPATAAVIASRNLITVVAEWPAGSGLEITLAPAARRGGARLQLRHMGADHSEWRRDVRWALERIANLRAAGALVEPEVTSVLEVRPAVVRALGPIEEGEFTAGPVTDAAALFRGRPGAIPWPAPLLDDASELVRAVTSGGLLYRVHLAPSSDVERSMVRDAVARTWPGPPAEAADYVGRTVRLRCLLAGTRGPVPAGARAVVRRLATHLDLVEPTDDGAWSGRPGTLAGHAVPVGLAYGLVRVPAAGSAPVPGLRTERPPARVLPLDPVPPAPRTPLRLGAAWTSTGRRVSVALDPTDLLHHMAVLGMTGTGKSSLIVELAVELLRQGVGFTVIDPHGPTATAIAQEAPSTVAAHLRVVRHGDAGRPVPVDVFGDDRDTQQRAIEAFVAYVQERFDPRHEGMVGARWRAWFGLIAEGTIALLGPRASLVAVVLVSISKERVGRLATALQASHPELSGRLRREIADVSGKESVDLFSWAASKLHPLMASDRIRAILGTGVDAVDLGAVIRNRQGLVIDLASMHLGRDGAELLGTLWVAKHVRALAEHTDPDRPHVLIVDEAHLFEHGGLPLLLAEGRKWGLGVVAATQETARLSRALAGALDANAASFVALRTGLRDAPGAAARLGGWSVEDLVRLPKLRAAATLSRDGVPTEPFSLDLDHWARSARRGPDPENRRTQAALVEWLSRAEFWEPHAEVPVITEEEIEDRLARAISRLGGPLRPGSPGKRSAPSFLDDWWQDQAEADDDAGAAPARPAAS